MKEIIKYQAVDGATFDTPEECLAYEKEKEIKEFVFDKITKNAFLTSDEEYEIAEAVMELVNKGKITINLEVK